MADTSVVPAASESNINIETTSASVPTPQQEIPNQNTNANNNNDTIMQVDSADKGSHLHSLSFQVKHQSKIHFQCADSATRPSEVNTQENHNPINSIQTMSPNIQQSAPTATVAVLNKSSITIVPKINIVAGPPPGKRNVAVKNPSAGVLKQTQKLLESTRKIKKHSSVIRNRLSDEDAMVKYQIVFSG